MASSDSGIESSAEVDAEMKDATSRNGVTLRDEVAASPSESSSIDVTAATQSNSQTDRIVCGECHAEFSLSTFGEFIDHKVFFNSLRFSRYLSSLVHKASRGAQNFSFE